MGVGGSLSRGLQPSRVQGVGGALSPIRDRFAASVQTAFDPKFVRGALVNSRISEPGKPLENRENYGGRCRFRTCDPRLVRQTRPSAPVCQRKRLAHKATILSAVVRWCQCARLSKKAVRIPASKPLLREVHSILSAASRLRLSS